MVSSHRRGGIGSCGTPISHPRFGRGASQMGRGANIQLDFSRTGRMSKDDERKVQTSQTLIQVAMIRLLLARLERKS